MAVAREAVRLAIATRNSQRQHRAETVEGYVTNGYAAPAYGGGRGGARGGRGGPGGRGRGG